MLRLERCGHTRLLSHFMLDIQRQCLSKQEDGGGEVGMGWAMSHLHPRPRPSSRRPSIRSQLRSGKSRDASLNLNGFMGSPARPRPPLRSGKQMLNQQTLRILNFLLKGETGRVHRRIYSHPRSLTPRERRYADGESCLPAAPFASFLSFFLFLAATAAQRRQP